MCLIIAPGDNGQKAVLPRDVFDYVYSRNDDGFGAMWCEDGQVKHFKGLSPSADEEYQIMQEMADKHPDIIFHMRYKTHGKVIPGLSHPFRILHRSRHGHDLFFMHNGVLSDFGKTLSYGQSDTTVFKDRILVPLLTRDPDALDNEETFKAIERLTAGSRLVFMRSDGKVWMTSKNSWNNRYGLTLSNTYMLPSQSYTSYTSGGYSSSYDPVNGKESATVYTIGRPPKSEDGPFNLYRKFKTADGVQSFMWCREVAPGYLRTQEGSLYRDRGANEYLTIADFIPKKEELHELCGDMKEKDKEADKEIQQRLEEAYTKSYGSIANDLDDDLPWADDDEKEDLEESVERNGGPANLDVRLRYARLVHNCHNGDVTCRQQLLGDLITMENKEFEEFVKEDPDTAATAFAEMIEVVLELNTWLSQDPASMDLSFDIEECLDMGNQQYHQQAIQRITQLRRATYEKLMQSVVEKEKESKVA